MLTGLDQSVLVAALEGFEAQLARLEGQIAHVKSLSSGKKVRVAASAAAAPKVKDKRKKRREVSEDGRRRMAEAQKRRWAAARGE
jgi:hypothetical protein